MKLKFSRILFAVGFLGLTHSIQANDGYSGVQLGGLIFTKDGIPLGKSKTIEMRSEKLLLSTEKVEVEYLFYNTGEKDEEVVVAFPVPYGLPDNDEDNSGFLKHLNFETWIDNIKLPPEKMKSHLTQGNQNPNNDSAPTKTYYWSQAFKSKKPLKIKHTYKPDLSRDEADIQFREVKYAKILEQTYCGNISGVTGENGPLSAARKAALKQNEWWSNETLNYILVTANSWAGPIQHFELTIQTPQANSYASACFKSLKRINDTTLRASIDSFVPTENLNVYFVKRKTLPKDKKINTPKELNLKRILEECNLGKSESCFTAGVFETDENAANTYLVRACLNHVVGSCDWVNTKTLGDSCTSGKLTACSAVGYILNNSGRSDEAAVYLEKACNAEIESDCSFFCAHPDLSKKINRNLESLCGKQCAEGTDRYSCNYIGYLAETREKQNQEKEAIKLYTVLCNQHFEETCEKVKSYQKKLSPIEKVQNLKQDPKSLKSTTDDTPTKQSLLNACMSGDMKACYGVGSLEYNQGKGDYAAAFKYFERACDGGFGDGCYGMGSVEYYRGNRAESLQYYKLACEKGCNLGCLSAGTNELAKRNIEEANKYFKKACSAGNSTACGYLKR